jgi:hypothetical protein
MMLSYKSTSLSFFLLFGLSFNVLAQKQILKIEKEDNQTLVSFIGNVSFFKNFKLSKYNISIIVTNNISGSASQPETDEVSSNIYISITEYDEYPDFRVFVIKNLLFPRDILLHEKGNKVCILNFSTGPKLNPQKSIFSIQLDSIKQIE